MYGPKPNKCLTEKCYFIFLFQSDDQQEAEGDGGSRVEFRQLQFATVKGTIGGTEQFRRTLPERQQVSNGLKNSVGRK